MRSVAEWKGKTDDTPVPNRVRLRVFLRHDGICHCCGRKIYSGDAWVCDHVVAIVNGGENRESNLKPLCDWCDKKVKTPDDVAKKSLTYRKQSAHLGLRKKKGPPIPGSRRSGLRKRMNGIVEKR